MRRALTTALAATGVCAGVLLGACGSQTRTVTVASTPPQTQASTATSPPTTGTATTTPSTATTPSSTAGGTSAPGTTRSAPEPAFTQAETKAEGVSAAAAVVRAAGFTPSRTSEYHPEQTLRVLVGTRTGSGDGYGQRAFFFVGGRYIGTDTKEPSATIRVVSQNDTAVTLAYPLYRHNDPLCCPGGGQATVRFELNNGRLAPVGTIPPASRTSALSRY